MKKIITVITIVLLTALIVLGVLFRINLVYVDGKLYDKDVETLFLIDMEKTPISELNRCRNLIYFYQYNLSNEDLEKMRVFEELYSINISDAVSEIKGAGIEKINMFPELKSLDFERTEFDLSNLASENLKDIGFSQCSISAEDIEGLKNCPSLEEVSFSLCDVGESEINELKDISSLCKLYFSGVVVDNSIIVTEDDDVSDLRFSHRKYTLKDSSFLADFDNITDLLISSTYIEDISGIEDMDSLKSLMVNEGFISEEYKKALEDKGIAVSEW